MLYTVNATQPRGADEVALLSGAARLAAARRAVIALISGASSNVTAIIGNLCSHPENWRLLENTQMWHTYLHTIDVHQISGMLTQKYALSETNHLGEDYGNHYN